VDLRSDAFGSPHFIEVNSLAGLNPVRSDLPILCGLAGISYDQLITDILNSALERAGLSRGQSLQPDGAGTEKSP
jgi:D-alanine-D-alanine ligase